MYLIFKLHKRGYPVNQVFEAEVKAMGTDVRISVKLVDHPKLHSS
jgi:hypothetical protein